MNSLQELAEFLRNLAYADEQSHHIDWSLHIIHPKTNEGDIGFGGGLWTHNRRRSPKHDISLSFSYSSAKGINTVMAWRDGAKIHENDRTISFDEFKQLAIDLFKVEELYNE